MATAASGLYSNGNYVAGDLSGTSATPAQAQDDSKWYTYASGVATAVNGVYSSIYYLAGEKVTSATPLQSQDDSKWYTYSSGVATAASGYYSNGYYVTGEISGAGDTSTPTQPQDNALYYTYTSGVATLFPAPAFTTDLPAGTQTYYNEQEVILTVEVSNAASYQWYHGSTAQTLYPLSVVSGLVSGVDTNSMTFVANADLGGGGKVGNYIMVVATNVVGSTSSSVLHWSIS